MKRISNTRRNGNFLRLAAFGAVVLLQTMFGGPMLSDHQAGTRHSSTAASEIAQPVVVRAKANQSKSAGSQNNQLSLMIFRSN